MKVAEDSEQNNYIELIFYSGCFSKTMSQIQNMKSVILKYLNLIQDRLKIKLILMEIDEKKLMSEKLKIRNS